MVGRVVVFRRFACLQQDLTVGYICLDVQDVSGRFRGFGVQVRVGWLGCGRRGPELIVVSLFPGFLLTRVFFSVGLGLHSLGVGVVGSGGVRCLEATRGFDIWNFRVNKFFVGCKLLNFRFGVRRDRPRRELLGGGFLYFMDLIVFVWGF